MTNTQLKSKVKAMLREDKVFIETLIDKAIKSGCMDIEGAENNYILPKTLLCAIYNEMSRQRKPHGTEERKQVENIQNFI